MDIGTELDYGVLALVTMYPRALSLMDGCTVKDTRIAPLRRDERIALFRRYERIVLLYGAPSVQKIAAVPQPRFEKRVFSYRSSEGRDRFPGYTCICYGLCKGRRGMEEGRNAARRRSAYAGKLSGATSGLAPKSRSRLPISSSFLGGYTDTLDTFLHLH